VNSFKLDIITPDRSFPPREVLSLNVPADKGPLTVLAHHQPMICCVNKGKAKITDAGGNEEFWLVEPGMLTVEHEIVTLLVQDITSAAART
jgi:F0F1-type ATP synthase epsilon subunit